MSKLSRALLIGGCAVFSGCPSAPREDDGFAASITVVLRNSQGDPLVAGSLQLSASGLHRVASTDAAGEAVFDDVAPGEYRLVSHRMGYVSQAMPVSVPMPMPVAIEVGLHPVGTRATIDTALPQLLADAGGRLEVPGHAFVGGGDRAKVPATVTVEFTALRRDAGPGTSLLLESVLSDGSVLRDPAVLVVYVEGINGVPIGLVPGMKLGLSWPVTATATLGGPGTSLLPLWFRDPQLGRWSRAGEAARDAISGEYRARVSRIGTWCIGRAAAKGQ